MSMAKKTGVELGVTSASATTLPKQNPRSAGVLYYFLSLVSYQLSEVSVS